MSCMELEDEHKWITIQVSKLARWCQNQGGGVSLG